MKFSSEQPEELSRRAHCDDELKKNNGTLNSPSPSKGEPRQPVPGINSDHVPAAISDRAGMRLEEDRRMLIWDNRMKVLIHRKHEKFRYHQTDLPPGYVQIR